jgi:hypothetical protein
MPHEYQPAPMPLGTDPIMARYIQDELRRIADAMASPHDRFIDVLDAKRLLGLGYLYAGDFSSFSTPWVVELTTAANDPVLLETLVVDFVQGDDNLLTESFVGGTVTPGTALTPRALNQVSPKADPVASVSEGATVTVPGTQIRGHAGSLLVRGGVAVLQPSTQFYIQFSQIGGGAPPTDVQLLIRLARIIPYDSVTQ